MSMKKAIGDKNILNKKVKAFTKKYSKVKSRVKSGNSSSKFYKKYPQHYINARFKKKELFKRMSPKKLYNLLTAGDEDRKVKVLVLDIRDEEAFDAQHIQNAVHYPHARISHATNPYITEIYRFKNTEGRIIVIYDNSEKLAIDMGNLFYEKQIDNVFVLTGGIRRFMDEYGEMVDGEPLSPNPSVADSMMSFRSGTSSSMATTSSRYK